MKSIITTTCCATMAVVLAFASPSAVASDNLGNVLRETGWDRIIGTWVDAETRGAKSRTTYSWRFKNQVIETTSKEGRKNSVSLMGHNPNKGEVFHVSADDKGGSSIGRWTFEKDEATLGLLFVTGTGDEGGLKIRMRLEDDDTMIVTIDLPDPIVFKRIRVEPVEKDEK